MANGNYIARYWEALPTRRVECLLCPRRCRLREGAARVVLRAPQHGRKGSCSSPTAGIAAAFASTRSRKKTLNHFFPGSSILSFGTAGCNLTCAFCRTGDISKSREFDRLTDSATPAQIARAAREKPAAGAVRWPSPTTDPWFSQNTRSTRTAPAREAGIKTVAVTAGYISPGAPCEEFFSAWTRPTST
jgi:pyruvate formate lyase activating enzyme